MVPFIKGVVTGVLATAIVLVFVLRNNPRIVAMLGIKLPAAK